MKKIKITKNQAKLLNLNEVNITGVPQTPQQTNKYSGRNDSLYKKVTDSSDIKNLPESDFNIKEPNLSSPNNIPFSAQRPQNFGKSTYKPIPLPESEEQVEDELRPHTLELIKYFYRQTNIFPKFFEEHGLSYVEICNALKERRLVIDKNGRYEIPKNIGNAKKAIQAIENVLKELLTSKGGNKQEVTENDSEHKELAKNADITILQCQDGLYFKYNDQNSEPIKIDNKIKTELINLYDKDRNIMKAIGAGSHPDYIQKNLRNQLSQRTPPPSDDEMLSKLGKEKFDKYKKMKAGELEEMTGSASSGAFTPPMGMVSREMPEEGDKIPVIKETLTDSSIGKQGYDTPGFADSKFFGNAGKKGKAPVNKGITHKKTTWDGGSFVKLDDCTKLNNNKKAQNGGCSTGAKDGVVKLKKTSGNITAPSLKEGLMRETLKLQHNRKEAKLIVLSDLEGKAASQETFRCKTALKKAGFNWNGNNWEISSDKLDIAKKTLSAVNNAEYIIDSVEDLEDVINSSYYDKKSELNAKIESYIKNLANATDEKALSAEIERYLNFFANFHNYSFRNKLLIFIQNPKATQVASYKKWQEKHRQVKKDVKGLTIFAPITVKKQEDNTEDDDSNDIIRYKPATVFDISDTVPIDERGEIPETPQWWGNNEPSETAEKLFVAISEVAKDMGIEVTQVDAKGGEKGFSAGDHINLTSGVQGVEKLSTMIHEMAHELMHWKKSSLFYQGDETKSNSAIKEMQAESVSYVVLIHYDLPVAHQPTYLALWKANSELIQSNLEVISKVSKFIIEKIDEEVERDNKQVKEPQVDEMKIYEEIAKKTGRTITEIKRLIDAKKGKTK